MPVFMRFTIQEWLIALAFFILILCVLEIRKLKKSIAREIKRQLWPQLILEMDKRGMCFYLKNEGFSIIQDIQIVDSKVTVEDSGFKTDYILRFENIGFLRPKEGIELKFQVFAKDQTLLPGVAERIFCHLINLSFEMGITCSDIEGRQIRFIFSKKGENFYPLRV